MAAPQCNFSINLRDAPSRVQEDYLSVFNGVSHRDFFSEKLGGVRSNKLQTDGGLRGAEPIYKTAIRPQVFLVGLKIRPRGFFPAKHDQAQSGECGPRPQVF